MTTKVFRGQLLVFTASPIDYLGNLIAPESLLLYLNYPHANGTASTDSPISMELQTDGQTWLALFDTANAMPGSCFASIRAEGPSAAEDFKFTIIANEANPDPP